jgi:hypothetical protein
MQRADCVKNVSKEHDAVPEMKDTETGDVSISQDQHGGCLLIGHVVSGV